MKDSHIPQTSKSNSLLLNVIFLILLCCVLCGQEMAAQNDKTPNFNWTQDLKLNNFIADEMKILKADENSIYYLLSLPNGKSIPGLQTLYEKIGKYNKKTGNITYLDVKLNTDNTDRVRLNIQYIDSTIHVISYFNNKSKKAVYIFDETINMNTFELNDDARKVLEINYKNTQITNSDRIGMVLDTYKHVNDSLLLLKYLYETNEGYVHGYELLTREFSSIVKYENLIEKDIDVNNCIFDLNYNLYTIERKYKTMLRLNFSNTEISLNYYSKFGLPSVKREVELDNKFIPWQTLSVNSKNQIVLGGLYACNGIRSATGVFSVIYNAQLQDEGTFCMHDFGYDFLSDGNNKKKNSYLNRVLNKCIDFDYSYEYIFKDIHFRKDGGFYLVVNKEMITDVGHNNSHTYKYIYSDIYIVAFNADGSFNWAQKIYRNESIIDKMTLTHYLGECLIEYGENDDLIIIHNVFNTKNLPKTKDSQFRNGRTYLTTINSKGEKTDKIISTDANITKTICPVISYNCGKNTYCLTRLNYLTKKNPLFFFNISNYTCSFGYLAIEKL